MAQLILDTDQAAFMTGLEAPMESAFAEGTLMPGGTPVVLPPYNGWTKLEDDMKAVGKNSIKSMFAAFVARLRIDGSKILPASTETAPVNVSTFVNGFGVWGDGNYSLGQVRYYKDDLNFVHVEGLVRTPSASGSYQTMFTLPAGFLPGPLDARIIPCVHNDGFASIQVGYDGTVVFRGAWTPEGWVSMNLIYKQGG